MAIETASRAENFIGSIGVNARLNEPGDIVGQMAYLGSTNMRISDLAGDQLGVAYALGASGVKFDLITVANAFMPVSLSAEMADINLLAPYTISVEGPNEINGFPITYDGVTGPIAAIFFQADLYNAVHSDPALQGVAVLPFSLAVGGNLTGFGNVTAYADEANVHAYASQGVPPFFMLDYAVSSITTVIGKPVVVTETGYYTLADGVSGVNQDVQAKWEMDELLEDFSKGTVKTYLFQLEDATNDTFGTNNNHYGLFNLDGTPKQAAVDIHNLTSILADTGSNAATFTPGSLDYTVTGLPLYWGFHDLIAKSNGAFDVALWSEPLFYDESTGTEVPVTPSDVTVSFGTAYDVSVYDPVVGTAAIGTYKDVTSVHVSLGTDPLIVELTPVTAASAPINTTTTTVLGRSAGATPDFLTVDNYAWNSSGPVVLGLDGTAIVTIQDAGSATIAGSLNLAVDAGSTGIIWLNAGAKLTVGTIAELGNAGGQIGGSATVAVAQGAVFSASQSFDVNAGATLVLTGGTVSGANSSGTTSVAAGATVLGDGLIGSGNGSGLTLNGVMIALGGTLETTGSVQGSGTLLISDNSTARIDGSSVSLPTIVFAGANTTLSLATGANVASNIFGFTAGDQIVMSGVDGAKWNQGTGALTLSDQGSTVATLHLGGYFADDAFDVHQTNAGAAITLHG